MWSVLRIEWLVNSLLRISSVGSGGALKARSLVGGGALKANGCDWKNACGCELGSLTM